MIQNSDAYEAAAALYVNLSCLDEAKPIIGSSQAVPFLIHLLQAHHYRRSCKHDALYALYNLSTHPANIASLLAAGIINRLHSFFTAPSGSTGNIWSEKALAILINLASSVEGKKEIVSTAGLIGAIAGILDNATPAEQEQAVSCLLILCDDDKCIHMVLQEGVIPALLVNHVALRTLRYGSDLFCLPSQPIPPPAAAPLSDLGFPVAASDAWEHRRLSQRGPLRTPFLFGYRPVLMYGRDPNAEGGDHGFLHSQKEGVLVASDAGASMGRYICKHLVIEINPWRLKISASFPFETLVLLSQFTKLGLMVGKKLSGDDVVHLIHVARRCPALSSDGVSLLAFKAAVSDDPWAFLAAWSEEDEDPCRWPGVSCVNVTGFIHPRVVGVSVSGKNLSGYIPPELGALLFLRRLNLHGNRLSGAVPPQLFNASSLRSLFLYDNFLSGPFPAAACVVPRLQILDLSQNAFSGPLPPALRGCRQLQHLLLEENRFSGEIPAGVWAEMSKVVQLDLSSNEFEGPIPPDLGELDSLGGALNLSHNRLSGAIPSELGNLPSTVILDLRYNNLSGEIPGTGSLANQSPTAFLGNPGLCGFPLTLTCEAPVGAPAAAAEEEGRRGMKAGLIAVISVADAAGVALVVVCAYWKVKNQQKGRAKLGHGGAGLGRWWCLFPCGPAMAEKKDGASSSEEEDDQGGGVEGELVAMDKGFKVELEELLRASAYVL
ncbi:hypothetical protein B296_00037233, partial [Ensete ventricosum]